MAKKTKMSLATIIVLVVVSISTDYRGCFAPDVMRHFKTQHILNRA